ncbi:MAG: polysaccharide deacetylase family protein [Bacteroidota bacterium]
MKRKKERIMYALVFTTVLGYLMACSGISEGNNTVAGIDSTHNKQPVKPVTDPFAWQPIRYDSTKQYIYLSFDDGPQHGTVTCFDLCKKDSIKASFFMVGHHSEMKSDGKKIVADIRNAYPQILLANHSYSHANNRYIYFYQHPEMAGADFFKAQEVLQVPYKIARLPGNSAWVRTGEVKATHLVSPVSHLLDSAGYNVIGWDVEWSFGKKSARPVQTPQKLANMVDSAFAKNQTHIPNHLVILTHDRMFQHPEDVDSLARFIQILKQNPRYVFETVDHYPGLKKPVSALK